MITCFSRNIFPGSSSVLHLEKRASLVTCVFRGSFSSKKPLFSEEPCALGNIWSELLSFHVVYNRYFHAVTMLVASRS